MRRSARLLVGSLALSPLLGACAEPPPPLPPVIQPAPPPLPPLPLAPPPLLAVPNAEASPQNAEPATESDVTALRSEGKRHAVERTKHGLLMLSEARGVMGVVKHAAEIRWAGFVENDALLIASGGSLLRAATPEDAIAGRFEEISKIDPAATRIASGGKVVAMVVPADGGAFRVSRDAGKHFTAERRPGTGVIEALEVRSDGVVVVAITREAITRRGGEKGHRAEIHAARTHGAWVLGPAAETFYGPAITHHGDTIVISVMRKGDKEGTVDYLGLDAAGRWRKTDYPESGWLGFTWADSRVRIDVPRERPGFPKPEMGDVGMLGLVGGIGGLGASSACRGAACLAHRKPVTRTPTALAFHDGVCAKEHVVVRNEKIRVFDGPGLANGHDAPHTVRECAKDKPAARASTLMLRGAAPTFVKLPATCAEGSVLATDRAAFVRCSSKYQGTSSIVYAGPNGALVPVVPALADDVDAFAAESASDGTTLIYTDKGSLLCRTDAPACVSLPREGFLAARPVPGGRALVARRGASDYELVIELAGDAAAPPFKMTVQDNVLDMELTAEGYVRLWTSPSHTRFLRPANHDPLLIRTDGVLFPDHTAR